MVEDRLRHEWRYEERPHNEDLTVATCWELLQSKPIGRIGFVVEGMVQIFPVNFITHDGSIYFRTTAYGPIGTHVAEAPASFQVDDFDEVLQSGWSVLVNGVARRVDDPALLTDLWGPYRPNPWAEGMRTLFVRVTVRRMTGRRVHPG